MPVTCLRAARQRGRATRGSRAPSTCARHAVSGSRAPSLAPATVRTSQPSTARSRELHAMARELRDHWAKLAQRLDEPVLHDGATAADELLVELEDRVRPAAAARPRSPPGPASRARAALSDLLLERNQAPAVRAARPPARHDAARLPRRRWPRARGDADARGLARGLAGPPARSLEDRGGRAAVAMARRSGARDRARRRRHAGPRRGAALSAALGTVGEAIDHSPLGQSGPPPPQPERVVGNERRRGRGGPRLHGHDVRRSGGSAAARRGALRGRSGAHARRRRDHRDRLRAARALDRARRAARPRRRRRPDRPDAREPRASSSSARAARARRSPP